MHPDLTVSSAQDDATLIAIRDQERAGLDIITDGEMRRESYSNRFATALDGVDIDNPGTALDRSGHPNPVPRVVRPLMRRPKVVGRKDRMRCRTWVCSTCREVVRSPEPVPIPAPCQHCGGIVFDTLRTLNLTSKSAQAR